MQLTPTTSIPIHSRLGRCRCPEKTGHGIGKLTARLDLGAGGGQGRVDPVSKAFDLPHPRNVTFPPVPGTVGA